MFFRKKQEMNEGIMFIRNGGEGDNIPKKI